jgi:hypothetical protein
MDSDTTHLGPVDPGNQGGQRRPPRWSGRTKRLVTTAAAGAVIFGGGTAIGIAMTGGASAATGSPPVTTATSGAAATPTPAASTSTGSGTTTASRCTKLVEQLVLGNHLKLAERLRALCTQPLLRLALVGGEHGTVTFKSKSGTTTAVFERGTVQSDTGSVITVTAADGTTWTWDITSSTVVRQNGSTASVGTGDQVFVAGTLVSGANDARLIRISSTSTG